MWVLYPGQIGIWRVGFCGGRKTGEPREKPWEQGQEPTTNSTHMTPGQNLTGPHWWEESTLTTAPSLLPLSEYGNEYSTLMHCFKQTVGKVQKSISLM